MRYLVRYRLDRFFQSEDAFNRATEGHVMIIDANDRAEAFIVAFETLTSQGNLVRTTGPHYGSPRFSADGGGKADLGMAGLSSEEMKKVYEAGVPAIGGNLGDSNVAMAHVDSVELYPLQPTGGSLLTDTRSRQAHHSYVDEARIDELKEVDSPEFDLSRLIQLCVELNTCHANDCFQAVAFLTRAILDHIPPILGFRSFAEVASNYGEAGRSFRDCMQHLEKSSRKIADSLLHTQVRKKESVPTRAQVNFSSDLGTLLAEIVRRLRSAA